MKYTSPYNAVVLFTIILVISCHTSKVSTNKSTSRNAYHSWYDDSTLIVKNGPLLMPYNRFIDPAGVTVRFGNRGAENHSLDNVLLPDGKILAVEDRYGVTFIDVNTKQVVNKLEYRDDKTTKDFISTFSGIKVLDEDGIIHLFWSAANNDDHQSMVFDATWNGKKATISQSISFVPVAPSPLALPNDIAVNTEADGNYLYVVLNGNSQLVKMRLSDKKTMWTAATGMAPYGIAIEGNKAYISNWAGPVPNDSTHETAGIPYADVYIDHRTGGTLEGTVSVIDLADGTLLHEIKVGLHPNAIIAAPAHHFVYVANGNSDNVFVINTQTDVVSDSISVKLQTGANAYIGDQPNALAINTSETRLYVANGMDNAVAVVDLTKPAKTLLGFIPTEAYPAGLTLDNDHLYVCNLEGEGSNIKEDKGYTVHHEEATVSIIPLPKDEDLPALTARVEKANLFFRTKLSQLLPRSGIAPKPVPERIGEPSLIKHVVYIIKENRTYDQVLGDMPQGDGMPSLTIYGDSVTPNQHELARDFVLLDNYYASGKSSAEGHQWTDAAMTSDYVEKNVRAWFRSYPHVQNDALVYNKEGFIWNDALDHGKTVRIYGEACNPHWDNKLGWKEIYAQFKQGKPIVFTNETTISRVRPILSSNCPCADTHDFPDVMRADAFNKELQEYEQKPGDEWPQLMIISLSSDHTTGTRPGYPTPRAMVADNDEAVGKIVEAISHSRFWNNTAIFITEDDSQDGWDHVSGYRTTGFVVSPFTRKHALVHTNYNQTCMVRTIEQILGIPPMNVIDATALPMFDCFMQQADTAFYAAIPNRIPLDEMNKATGMLKGKELHYAIESSSPQFDKLDGGDDDLLNHILWYAAKGNLPYPGAMITHDKDDK